jgi:hypothetical protein
VSRIVNRKGTKFWIRLSPNPGFQFGKLHWCAFGGLRDRKKNAKFAKQRAASEE